MHGRLQIGDTTVLVSDGRCEGGAVFHGFALSITVPDEASAAQELFTALTDGGHVRMPLGKTFFSPRASAWARTASVCCGWFMWRTSAATTSS